VKRDLTGRWQAAEQQVAEITARVKASNQSGGLRQWNAAYKQYRQAQIAKCEKAIPIPLICSESSSRRWCAGGLP
jgi:hypothetical protein